jgi:hypothetical protein
MTLRLLLLFFLQEGTFELELVDLAAQRAADAAFATAIAATSAIAATAEHAPARRNSSASTTGTKTPSKHGDTAAVPTAAAAAAPDEDEMLNAAAVAAGFAAAAGPGLGSLPTLAQHGVLASVRVKDGKALGTLGYERELRRQRHASVPRRVGVWFCLVCFNVALYLTGSLVSAWTSGQVGARKGGTQHSSICPDE